MSCGRDFITCATTVRQVTVLAFGDLGTDTGDGSQQVLLSACCLTMIIMVIVIDDDEDNDVLFHLDQLTNSVIMTTIMPIMTCLLHLSANTHHLGLTAHATSSVLLHQMFS